MTSPAASPTTITLAIAGMTCGACERHLGDALRAVPGVARVEVDRPSSSAIVVATGVAATRLVDAVRHAGYDADMTVSTPVPEPAPAPADSTAPTASSACCGCCEGEA